ncbi:hypothetical protein DCW30_10750 [Streptomyces alfalfae]|uniref:Tat pathway signal sequence domain protein n=1 Tax=Streptomyces alfalfae TaxID=1642299 RepID=A0A1P8TI37_9ACTN|nr:hypothetical protein [Streptomyces alfalfae]AYA17718.1 hypothetical protein D3X13_17000 [Streptomyces fradiae]APY87310.1 hypothetical protein A7J05_17645 [Streptomyces alfalfae]QQC90390.1 hypothetical protein I8755_19735 [Streptomyces alfalfae]QUI32863.1 hypothetical protein H9W91_19915 [Streptomyces alfalfae]RXX44929.1 hypothetical protein DCW30_10750 [Streptomyces alfalfae]
MCHVRGSSATAAVLLAVLVSAAPPPPVAHAVAPTPIGPLTFDDETARAGSRAGEGRERPGGVNPRLPDPPPPPPEPSPYVPAHEMPPAAAAHRDAVPGAEREPAGPVLPGLRVLPLGGGLLLIGLGLGFLGLRLRRG